MILEIRLQNFYSINEEVVLNLQAGNINNKNAQRLKANIFEDADYRILKTAVIYGANASGKSNVIKAIRICARLILDSHQFNQGTQFSLKPFKFNEKEQLSTFFIRFVNEGIIYEYAFSVDLYHHRFVEESLYHYPNGRRAKIFERDEDKGLTKKEKYHFGQGIKRPFDVAENTSDKTLYLSRASQMDRNFAKQIYSYFNNQFILQYYDNGQQMTASLLQDEEAKQFLLKSLQIADSDIVDIDFEKELVKGFEFKFGTDAVLMAREEVVKPLIKIKTFHRSNPNIAFDFENEESAGTQKLFYVLLNVFGILRQGKTLIIDEIETHLHPKIVAHIIDLFHKSECSQLICTTHNTHLLDLKRFRKDQIYFVNKQVSSASDLYSLYDYKDFRETMDLEKAYLQGRFDAVPLIQD